VARPAAHYVCQACGASTAKWSGRCDACGEWNTIVEEAASDGGAGVATRGGRAVAFVGLDGAASALPRQACGIAEFDRVCGGGLVPGSALLVGGDPGIGKSTLLLQVAARLADASRCAYVSGEESVDQMRMRAARLGIAQVPVRLAAETAIRDILAALDRRDGPEVVIIDSIQTMYLDLLDSAPGTVAQVRACAQALVRLAKRRGFTVLLVGHVTKEGMIAGPKVLEHMVDTVLYFEGERSHQFRILRAVKNRFGPTDEIGVFEMTDAGLIEVANPSALFLAERRGDASGAAVFAGIEGSRPVLVEIQALVAPSPLATPRRAVVGWDGGRLAMLLAVLETRAGVALMANDVYLNVAGGLRITEPAADLAVAAALVSSLSGVALPEEAVVFGEVGLSGEIRAVNQPAARLKEAARLGFARAYMPARRQEKLAGGAGRDPLEAHELWHVRDLVGLIGDAPGERGNRAGR
jgi:DNA repair protein RadA/Sms